MLDRVAVYRRSFVAVQNSLGETRPSDRRTQVQGWVDMGLGASVCGQ
jgi:hypothetical protein